jgi:uncharacterized repeat protein (TIGR03803 family)
MEEVPIHNKSRSIAMRLTRLTAAVNVAAGFLIAMLAALSAQAQNYKVLYTFEGSPNAAFPSGTLVNSKEGLYGATSAGGNIGCGRNGCGVLFKLDNTGKETVIYSFCDQPDCADGVYPNGVIGDSKGNLYGTTDEGGASKAGVVFKLSKAGKETVLYSFCAQSSCTDGAYPYAGVVRNVKEGLYGTTYSGGTSGSGTVFKLSTNGKETVLHSFTGGADGANPLGEMIEDSQGNLYGTTYYGGDLSCGSEGLGCGVVFKVSKAGRETVLHSFKSGSDGQYPTAGVIRDAEGNLYGTTRGGGSTACLLGCGTVFKLSKMGKETILHLFTGAADGANPESGLIRDTEGNLYGTTYLGGKPLCTTYGCGTVFKLSKTGKETVLYSFTGEADGESPQYALVRDAKGNLCGTTLSGNGDTGYGVVFKLTPQ